MRTDPKFKPKLNEMMVNAVELMPRVGPPPRALARGARPPEVEFEQREGGVLKGVCPGCGTKQPAITLSLTVTGWLCGGCISDQRRLGKFKEWE